MSGQPGRLQPRRDLRDVCRLRHGDVAPRPPEALRPSGAAIVTVVVLLLLLSAIGDCDAINTAVVIVVGGIS